MGARLARRYPRPRVYTRRIWLGTAQPTITGVLAGNLPTPTGALAGGVSTSGLVAGSLPAMTGGTGRVNLAQNPSAQIDLTGWSANTTVAPTRVTGLTGLPKTTGIKATAAGYFRSSPGAAGAVTVGEVYSVSVWGVATNTSDLSTCYLVWYDSGGADITYNNYGSFSLPAGNTPGRKLMENQTAPAGAVAVGIIIDANVDAILSSVLIEPGATSSTYADGDTAGWSWGGTTGLSASSTPGALTGDLITTGVLAGNLPTPTSSLSGSVTASGVIAGSLPGLDGELTADSNVNGVLAGSLPTPAGALSCSLSASGALAGSLPTPAGSLAGSVAATGAIAGVLPTPTGAFTTGSGVDGVVAGALPTPTGALAGTVSWLGSTAGQLPALTGALSGIISTSGLISGLLPAPTQSLAGVIRVNGLIAGVLPTIAGSFSNIVFASDLTRWEMAIYRLNTKEFIKADPIKITLHTRLYARTATGGVSTSAGSNRPEQTFKLIMQSPAGNSLEQRTQDGTERQVDYILLGEWNAQVEVGDWWEDVEQNVWEVVALVPYNGYETRAVVEAHGKTLEGG